VLVGGPDEIEECQRIAQACGPWLINLCGQTAILDIPPLCEPARFIVANDTGTAHLAAATTVPMLVLCGPTDPRRVKPLGDNVTTLQADLPCINCYRKDLFPPHLHGDADAVAGLAAIALDRNAGN
jgi:ADP-heptose:LPS heptosyltransferase